MQRICEPVVVSAGSNCNKEPEAVFDVVMIAEPHLSVHVFPACGFGTMDLHTGHDDLDREWSEARPMAGFQRRPRRCPYAGLPSPPSGGICSQD